MTSRSKLITANLKHTAVYWGNPQSDGAGGRTFDDPVEVSVRWENTTELFIDAYGQERRSMAIVYTTTNMALGGFIVESTLNALSSGEEADPQTITTVREIRRVDRMTNLKASTTFYKVWL